MRSHASEPRHTPEPGSRPARGERRATVPPANPGGRLTPPEVLALQRLAGNAATVRRLAEQHHESRHDVQRTAVHQALRSAGRPLDEPVRAEMETRLGADFSDVRVHTDATAHVAADSVQAHAFTSGSHIVFQRGRYDTTSSAGKRMLAHELTHVMQQRSGPVAGTDAGDGLRVSHPSDAFERAAEATAERAMSAPVQRDGEQTARQAPTETPVPAADGTAVQRDVGFEVELGAASSYAFAPALKPAERSGEKHVVTPITSIEWTKRRPDRPWWRPQIDPPSMARRLAKKECLVDVPGLFTVEADDAFAGGSNVEFVTGHFPEGAAGRAQLAQSINGMVQIAALLDGGFRTATELAAAAPGTARVPTAPADHPTAEYVVSGFGHAGNPQVTAGIPMENLAGLYAAVMTAYGERNHPDRAIREASPDLAHQDHAGVLREAKQRVDQVSRQRAAAGEPLSNELQGLLLLVAAYLISGRNSPNQVYFKGIAPIMARTDFATMFAGLSDPERTRLSAANGDPFVQVALECANLAAGTAGEPVLASVGGGAVQFREVSRQAWLSRITQGTDLLSSHGYASAFPAHAEKADEFESMGSLGARSDTTADGRPAPVVELRRMRKDLAPAEWAPVLLGVFDMIMDIVQNRNNNPTYRRA